MFASLRLINYRIWFIGALVANVGTWMQRVAQDWLVLAVLPEGTAVHVGVVTGLQFLPVIFLSPWAGLIADRVDRRKMLITTQAGMGLLALALGALVLLGDAQVWHVYLFALALGILSAFDAPARQVFVSDIVPSSSLANAVALNSASFNAARLVGPGVAGLLIALVGTGWVFIINAITFAGTIGAMLAMRTALLQQRDRPVRAKGQLREGLAYVRGRSDIITIMIVVFVVGGLGLKFQLTSAAMAHVEFGMGAGEYGVLGSVLAIGSLLGALMAARRKRPRLRLVLAAAFGFGVSSGVMAWMPTYELFALSAIPVGFFSLTMLTSANAAIQVSTDPSVRGRVMSLYLVVFFAGNPIGGPVVGWISEAWGPRWAIGIGAIAAILVASIAAIWTAKHHEIKVRYRLRERPHLLVQNAAQVRASARVQPPGAQIGADARGTAPTRAASTAQVVPNGQAAADVGHPNGQAAADVVGHANVQDRALGSDRADRDLGQDRSQPMAVDGVKASTAV